MSLLSQDELHGRPRLTAQLIKSAHGSLAQRDHGIYQFSPLIDSKLFSRGRTPVTQSWDDRTGAGSFDSGKAAKTAARRTPSPSRGGANGLSVQIGTLGRISSQEPSFPNLSVRAIPVALTDIRHPENTQDARIIYVSTAVVSATAGSTASHSASVVHPGASSHPASVVRP